MTFEYSHVADTATAAGYERFDSQLRSMLGSPPHSLDPESSDLFDVYTGPNLGAGKKSLAFHVTLQSDSRTLTDQDVAKFLERVEREVGTLGGELRRE